MFLISHSTVDGFQLPWVTFVPSMYRSHTRSPLSVQDTELLIIYDAVHLAFLNLTKIKADIFHLGMDIIFDLGRSIWGLCSLLTIFEVIGIADSLTAGLRTLEWTTGVNTVHVTQSWKCNCVCGLRGTLSCWDKGMDARVHRPAVGDQSSASLLKEGACS